MWTCESICVFIGLWTALSTTHFVCMTLYTLLTLIPFIGSQLQCSQSIALTYHLINYLGPETWLREWYYNFWWRKNGVSFCGPLEKYVYQDKSTHSFVNKNDLDSFSEEHVCLRITLDVLWEFCFIPRRYTDFQNMNNCIFK